MNNCKKYIQLCLSVIFLCSLKPCFGQVGRAPANFVPDDDEIVVPIIVEKNFMEEFHEKHEKDFRAARKRLTFWMQQEQYAQDYGLENTGVVDLPTDEEKMTFLNRNYLRFLSKDVEKSTNSTLQDTVNSWNTNDEIDAIKSVELHNRVIIESEKTKKQRKSLKEKTVKVGKDELKFGFQPRVEIGMMKFTMKSKFFYARAWVGVNGNQELNIERRFKSTGTKAFVNYFIDDSRVLAVIDQQILPNVILRATHSKFNDKEIATSYGLASEENVLQLRYHIGF